VVSIIGARLDAMKEIEQRNSPAVNQNTLQLLGPLRNVFWNPPFNLRQGVCMDGRAVSVHGDDSRSRIFGQKANILVDLGFSIVPTGVLEMKILDPLLLTEACAIFEKLL
jgi:hypothetical protein